MPLPVRFRVTLDKFPDRQQLLRYALWACSYALCDIAPPPLTPQNAQVLKSGRNQ
jgi:hypothetical protein